MKKLELSNDGYRQLLSNFKEWLQLLGYAQATVYSLPIKIQEFLHYLEQNDINEVEYISIKQIEAYYLHLQCRDNTTKIGGGLSNSYLNHHQWALKKFKQYLFKHYQIVMPLHFKSEKVAENSLEYLTIEEVKSLFETTNTIVTIDALKQRYRAMLVLLYCCGLRRNEASLLNAQDISFERRLLVINHGKNSKQRYVPINTFGLDILRDYMLDSRIACNKKSNSSLLLGLHGSRLSVSSIGKDIKIIVEATNNKDLLEKNVTAHMLRHSIATHLLDSGMPIEDISLFLGHSSLESTQIYTHILDYDRL